MRNVKVAHLTSAHPRADARIFLKECRSLAEAGFEVCLVVADGLPDEERGFVKIYSVRKPLSRIDRMLNATRRVYEKALSLDADIYHLHDPELMACALKLKRKGKVVVFDAHEDFPLQLLSKHYANRWILKALALLAGWYEHFVCKRLDGVVAATPTIRDKFLKINGNTVDVNNYPVIDEFPEVPVFSLRKQQACYIGAIDRVRGVEEIIKAMGFSRAAPRLIMAGTWSSDELRLRMAEEPGWEQVDYLGHIGRDEVSRVLSESLAGLVTLHPIPNYLDALPVKMFEYMAAGLPVIASDIPLWRNIIDECGCGVCVDPLDPKAIGDAIDYILDNPDVAERMGHQGRESVKEKYNWYREEGKLTGFYHSLI